MNEKIKIIIDRIIRISLAFALGLLLLQIFTGINAIDIAKKTLRILTKQ